MPSKPTVNCRLGTGAVRLLLDDRNGYRVDPVSTACFCRVLDLVDISKLEAVASSVARNSQAAGISQIAFLDSFFGRGNEDNIV